METKVIFRVWKAEPKTVLALFPDLLEEGYTCLCYEMNNFKLFPEIYKEVLPLTRPALPHEYAELEQELKNIGYNLKIRKKR